MPLVFLAAFFLILGLPGCGKRYPQAVGEQTTGAGTQTAGAGTQTAGTGTQTAGAGTQTAETGEQQMEGRDGSAAPADSGHGESDGEFPADADSSESMLRVDTERAADEDSLGNGSGGAKDASHTISLLFAGDIYLSDHVLNAYDKAGGISGVLDEGLRQEIRQADLFMANQEFPFSDRGTAAADKQFTFRLPSSRVHIMQEIGADIVTLANNHTLDYGTDALLDSCRLLDKAGILRVGAGADREEAGRAEILEIRGKRIGFLAASRVFPEAGWAAGSSHPGLLSAYDPAAVAERIREVKAQCDYLVFYVHWGIERNTTPEEYQRQQARQYIDAGADLVVGSHPHVLQGIEYYNGKPILYSLGNFVFGSSIPETMLMEAEVTFPEDEQSSDKPNVRLRLIPATSSAGYTRMLAEEKRGDFFAKMESLSWGISVDEEGVIQTE